MTFNAQEMISSLSKSGVAKTSHYEVEMDPPWSMKEYQPYAREMLARAETAELPGRTITTTDFKFSNYGPISKIPYGQVYTDVTCSFVLSEDMREKQFFEIWQQFMVDTGAFASGGYQSKFNVRYFWDYCGRVTIRQYGSNGSIKNVFTLIDAYPIIISPISMSYGSDEIAKMSVTFAYRHYVVAWRKEDQPERGIGLNFSIGRGGVNLGLNIPGFANFSIGKGAPSFGKQLVGAVKEAATSRIENAINTGINNGMRKYFSG